MRSALIGFNSISHYKIWSISAVYKELNPFKERRKELFALTHINKSLLINV